MNIYKCKSGSFYNIVKIPDEGLLQSIGIFPGVKVKKISEYKMGGPVHLLIGTRNVAIGKKIAKFIEVEECK